MRRKQSELDQIEVPGGGALPRGSGGTSRVDELRGMVERSVHERGGYPTRGGVQLKTKTDINRDAEQQRARNATQKFRKGGMVGKSSSCKSHVNWSK
jgi:hypothetical protein